MKTPNFKTLEEEREFWDTHDSTDFLEDFKEAKDVVFVRPKKEVISLRLDPKITKKLKELADKECSGDPACRRKWRCRTVVPCETHVSDSLPG
ncbi:MAG: hypothetical protein H8D67_19290 [Deltaproteobacteria bacterium]|nr:hypothetical protein [Deltaproteobacteria bacterium]